MSDNRKFTILIAALFLVLVVAWLSDSGYVLNTGFGEYTTTTTSKSIETDPVTNQQKITTTTTTEIHPAKTLWDWMGLLIIPLALGLGVWWLNKQQKESELHLSEERQQEAVLQGYLDKMSELLLKEDLQRRYTDVGQPVRDVAQARTTTVLRVLDSKRRNIVTQFLEDSHLEDGLLIKASLNNADLREIWFIGFNLNEANFFKANLFGANLFGADLSGADLSGADLSGADLINANLIGASLFGANLSEANLLRADLSKADLSKADLSEANLDGANLSEAKLNSVNITNEQLSQAKSLKGAIMPDGTIHE